jgi:hypothetical protein
MDWFQRLTGFKENGYDETRAKLTAGRYRLASNVNGESWAIGEFEMASLSELRRRAAATSAPAGRPAVRVIQGDVRKLHAAPEYAEALFQVASQFNALEMVGPNITPEDGVTRYQNDHTQGPACAIAAGAATIFRNYFVPVGASEGQTKQNQLNGIAEIGVALSAALDRPVADLWTMRNGYALCSRSGLEAISGHLASLAENQIDELRGHLSIGLQRGVEMTDGVSRPGQLVSQAFCSALPVAYTNVERRQWSPFARLILEAVNRPGFAGGSNFPIGWSHDEQNDEQIFSRGSRPRGADGFGSRKRARHAVGGRGVDRRQDRLFTAHVA